MRCAPEGARLARVELSAVLVDHNADLAQGTEVTVDRTWTERAAARHGHHCLSAAAEQRSHDHEAGAHLADKAVGCVACAYVGCVQPQLVAMPRSVDADVAQDLFR